MAGLSCGEETYLAQPSNRSEPPLRHASRSLMGARMGNARQVGKRDLRLFCQTMGRPRARKMRGSGLKERRLSPAWRLPLRGVWGSVIRKSPLLAILPMARQRLQAVPKGVTSTRMKTVHAIYEHGVFRPTEPVAAASRDVREARVASPLRHRRFS